jgi:hypothetical protein
MEVVGGVKKGIKVLQSYSVFVPSPSLLKYC